MMTDLSEILKGYFSFEWDKHEVYESQLQKFYDRRDTRITQIVSERFQLKAKLGFVWPSKNGMYEVADYADDMEIINRTDKRCLYPLDFIPDCNYSYYGCYLTIACFMHGIVPERLMLFHGLDNNRLYSYKYRSEIAKIFLGNRLRSLKGIEAAKEEIQFIPQTKLQFS